MSNKFPLGIDSFEKLRAGNYYYIDKTAFIQKLLESTFEVNLITRPRRFGKTLIMSMMEAFFNIEKNSKENFQGLIISESSDLCDTWMNKWPTIFLTFKSVEGEDFESAYGMLTVLIADLCKKYDFLLQSPLVNAEDRAIFHSLMARKADAAEIKNSLYTLMRMLNAHYKKSVILLLDEYDVPLAHASEMGYYPQMLALIRAILGKSLKSNEYLKFSVVTGCLKIAKESIFSGTNNFVSDTITGDRFDEYFGFTEKDMEKLLADSELTDHMHEMREWYDGYRFGTVDVYCPWDVLNHASALQSNPLKKPQNYWGATSHNSIIYRFISRDDIDVNDKFEILMDGNSIVEHVTEELTYDTIRSTEENLWSLLYLTGYLTRDQREESGDNDSAVALRIPNEEIRSLFKSAIIEWFNDTVRTTDRTMLFEALWNGNSDEASRRISDILFSTISYHDYQESYYHAFIAGLFSGAGYIVESNYEYGTGRPDIVVKDKKNRRAIVIEIKNVNDLSALEKGCGATIRQIREQKYTKKIEQDYRTVLCYGAAFYKKTCMIR